MLLLLTQSVDQSEMTAIGFWSIKTKSFLHREKINLIFSLTLQIKSFEIVLNIDVTIKTSHHLYFWRILSLLLIVFSIALIAGSDDKPHLFLLERFLLGAISHKLFTWQESLRWAGNNLQQQENSLKCHQELQ